MKETAFLVVSRKGVQALRKTLPDIKRGEIVLKVHIEVPDEAFAPPVLEQRIFVENWRQGIDLEDVDFDQNIITEEEAELIRNRRIEKMKTILEGQGYTVQEIEEQLE